MRKAADQSKCNTLAADLQKTKTKNDNESQVCLRVTIITSKINYVVKHVQRKTYLHGTAHPWKKSFVAP